MSQNNLERNNSPNNEEELGFLNSEAGKHDDDNQFSELKIFQNNKKNTCTPL